MKVVCNNLDCEVNDCHHKKPHKIVEGYYYHMETGEKINYNCMDENDGCKNIISVDEFGNETVKYSWCIGCEMDDEFNNEINRILDI